MAPAICNKIYNISLPTYLMEFNKLVRDKIPDNWNPKYGKNPKTHIAEDKEFYEKLKEKLLEETKEFLREDNENEIADILEVIYALCDYKEISKENIESIRKNREMKSGAFKKRIILEKSEES